MSGSPPNTGRAWQAAVGGFTLLSLAGVGLPHGYLSLIEILDDALMYARYADNVLRGFGISWNEDGSRTYGGPSLIHLLLMVLIRAAAPDMFAVYSVRLASFIPLIFLYTFLWMRWRVAPGFDRQGKQYIFPILILTVTLSVNFRANALNGMETTLAVVLLLFFTYNCLKLTHASDRDWTHAALAAASGSIVYATRPDAVLVIGLFTLALWIWKRDRRLFFVGATVAASTGATLVFARLYFGHWFPLPFYVKSLGVSGGNFPFLASFFLDPVVVLLFVSSLFLVIVRPNVRVQGILLLGAIGIHMVYMTFLVHQMMGQWGRMYMPMCGGLLAFVVHAVETEKESQPGDTSRIQMAGLRLCVIVLMIASVSVAIRGIKQFRKGFPPFRGYADVFARALPGKSVALLLTQEKHPRECTIAATEIGIVGILFPRHHIYDLVGLNSTEIALQETAFGRKTLAIGPFLQKYHPDLLITPHPLYIPMIHSLIADPFFRENYVGISQKEAQLPHGLAVYKKGPCYDHFRQMVQGADRKLVPTPEAFPDYASFLDLWKPD